MDKPFWEDAYRIPGGPNAFDEGQPSQEVAKIVAILPAGSRVLDLGCGDGRNSLLPAEKGLQVTAVDISSTAIEKLERLTKERGLSVEIINQDMRLFTFEDSYDLIISHGCLHLIEREHWAELIRKMQANTKRNGYNIISVFTDSLPPPTDLQKFTAGLFKEGELFDYYHDWTIISKNSRIFKDEHPGGVRHRHASNKIVAQKS